MVNVWYTYHTCILWAIGWTYTKQHPDKQSLVLFIVKFESWSTDNVCVEVIKMISKGSTWMTMCWQCIPFNDPLFSQENCTVRNKSRSPSLVPESLPPFSVNLPVFGKSSKPWKSQAPKRNNQRPLPTLVESLAGRMAKKPRIHPRQMNDWVSWVWCFGIQSGYAYPNIQTTNSPLAELRNHPKQRAK